MGRAIGFALAGLLFASCVQKSIAVPRSFPDLRDVYVPSEVAVFAVGEDGEILFYDGSSWTTQDNGRV